MAPVTGRAFDIPLFKRVLTYALPYRSVFILGLFLTIILAFLAPLRPWLIQFAFDNYILLNDKEGLLKIILLMTGLLFLESVIQFYNTYLTNWLGQSIIKDLRISVYKHILRLKLRYFDNTAIGTLVTRVVSDIETIAEIFSQGLLVIMGDILQLVVVVAVMFLTDWRLALISLSTVPALIITTYIFKRAIKSAFQGVRTQVSNMNAFVQEHITGMSIIQIFNREKEEMKKFKKINRALTHEHLRTVWIFSIFFPVVEALSAISLGLLIWWGTNNVLEGTVTLGNLIAFILYIYMMFRPIRQLADRFNTLQMGMVGSERVFKVLDTNEVIPNNGNTSTAELKGNIEYKNVWFAYNDKDWVLQDINFKVKEGETLAIVGATGAGKTSIINTLSRLYDINHGEILIDGLPNTDYDLHELRESIAVVMQDVFLFSDTIYKNISLNNADISESEVQIAAKLVGVHDFIQQLPGEYDYNVQERGAVLSVGQRQLIAFLRAYVSNPTILVLDEATSSVDSETELAIQRAIQTLTRNRTSIIIAHRLATIKAADNILVMDHGKIVESGTHEELLKAKGIYKRLYELSLFKEEIEPK
jgi:ATP-binding cassette subfamily B protein